jgi:hypothetical protein
MTINKNRLNKVLSYLPFYDKNILLLGGTVRYICDIQNDFRDIDLIVYNEFQFDNIKCDCKTNIYGGRKYINKGKEIDIWTLGTHIIPCEIWSDVQETWRLSIDALYYHVATDTLYDKYFSRNLQINFKYSLKDSEKIYINYKLSKFKI